MDELAYLILMIFPLGWAIAWVNVGHIQRKPTTIPDVRNESDPYLIAYLKGGISQLVYVLLFKLVKTGLIEKSKGFTHFRRKKDVEETGLTELEKIVFNFFNTSRNLSALKTPEITEQIRNALEKQYTLPDYQYLIYKDEDRLEATKLKIAVALVAGIAGVVTSILSGLWPIAALSVLGGLAIINARNLPPIPPGGEKYLAQVELLFNKQKDQFNTLPLRDQLMHLALFASTMLAQIGWGAVAREYNMESPGYSSSSGCGSGCSSSCSTGCSSGGGDGGGCGGGGCGGGCGGCG